MLWVEQVRSERVGVRAFLGEGGALVWVEALEHWSTVAMRPTMCGRR